MKIFFNIFLRFRVKSLLWLLSIAGIIPACDHFNPAAKYGVPHADYKISGKITSETTNSPISNILVKITDSQQTLDSLYTDSDGNYISNILAFPEDKHWTIKVSDIDGSIGGEFQDKDSLLNIPKSLLHGGDDDWYFGKAEVTVNLKLKNK